MRDIRPTAALSATAREPPFSPISDAKTARVNEQKVREQKTKTNYTRGECAWTEKHFYIAE